MKGFKTFSQAIKESGSSTKFFDIQQNPTFETVVKQGEDVFDDWLYIESKGIYTPMERSLIDKIGEDKVLEIMKHAFSYGYAVSKLNK